VTSLILVENSIVRLKNLLSKLRVLLLFIALAMVTLGGGTSCSQRPYYSSERVYNARKSINKKLKKRGYRNNQKRYKPGKKTKWRKKRGKKFKKSKYKTGGGFFRRLFRK